MDGESVNIEPKASGEVKTATYKPQAPYQYWRYPRDIPPLVNVTARQMLNDSTVQLGLAARIAPILSCQFAYKDGDKWVDGVRASSPQVGEFVHKQLQRIWKNGLSQILYWGQIWGHSAAEIVRRTNRMGQQEIDYLLTRESQDVRPILKEGKVDGVRFLKVVGVESGHVDLSFPNCLWHAHNPMPGFHFGTSVLTAPYSPWWDKHMQHGALDVRRLFMTKDSYRGARVRYPSGTTEIYQPDGSTKTTPNNEIAHQIVENIKSGAVFSLPGDYDANGNPLWAIEEAVVANNPQHIFQYVTELDAEILNAMGIADDVLKSEATGSWAGKAVPQQATYCILEQWLCDILRDVNRPIEPLVEVNFGPGHQYEITTKPLAEQMLEQQNQGQKDGDGDGRYSEGNDPSGFDSSPWMPRPNRPPGQPPQQQRMSADPILDVAEGRIPAQDFVESVRLIVETAKTPPERMAH